MELAKNLELTQRAVSVPCPFCRCELEPAQAIICTECETPLHRECHAELGGCARFACVEAATPRRRLQKWFGAVARADVFTSAGAAVSLPFALLLWQYHQVHAAGLWAIVLATFVAAAKLTVDVRRAWRASRGEIDLATARSFIQRGEAEYSKDLDQNGVHTYLRWLYAISVVGIVVLAAMLFNEKWDELVIFSMGLLAIIPSKIGEYRAKLHLIKASQMCRLWKSELVELTANTPRALLKPGKDRPSLA
jgi:hypothetical protein